MAQRTRGDLLVLHVRDSEGRTRLDALKSIESLTRDLGGEFNVVDADSVVDGILSFAYRYHVTQCVVGESLRRPLQEWLHGSVENQLIRKGITDRHPRDRQAGTLIKASRRQASPASPPPQPSPGPKVRTVISCRRPLSFHCRRTARCGNEAEMTAGDNPDRLRSEAAFAHLCGVSPIPASSGRTDRHRLNRGGDGRRTLPSTGSCSVACGGTAGQGPMRSDVRRGTAYPSPRSCGARSGTSPVRSTRSSGRWLTIDRSALCQAAAG